MNIDNGQGGWQYVTQDMLINMYYSRPHLWEIYLRDVWDPPGMMYKALTVTTRENALTYAEMFKKQHKIAQIKVIPNFPDDEGYEWTRPPFDPKELQATQRH